MKESMLSLLRHGLTFLGGYLVAQGWLDDATMTGMVGAIVTLAGAAWGMWEKQQRLGA